MNVRRMERQLRRLKAERAELVLHQEAMEALLTGRNALEAAMALPVDEREGPAREAVLALLRIDLVALNYPAGEAWLRDVRDEARRWGWISPARMRLLDGSLRERALRGVPG